MPKPIPRSPASSTNVLSSPADRAQQIWSAAISCSDDGCLRLVSRNKSTGELVISLIPKSTGGGSHAYFFVAQAFDGITKCLKTSSHRIYSLRPALQTGYDPLGTDLDPHPVHDALCELLAEDPARIA